MTKLASYDGGFVAAEWLAGLALLVVPVLLVVVTVPAWVSAHAAAASAAREGARAAGQAGTAHQARRRAVEAVGAVLSSRGIEQPPQIEVALPSTSSGHLAREGVVAVEVRIPTDGIVIGPINVQGPTVVGSHRRSLDPMRSRGP